MILWSVPTGFDYTLHLSYDNYIYKEKIETDVPVGFYSCHNMPRLLHAYAHLNIRKEKCQYQEQGIIRCHLYIP